MDQNRKAKVFTSLLPTEKYALKAVRNLLFATSRLYVSAGSLKVLILFPSK